jgi:hypothetical protein
MSLKKRACSVEWLNAVRTLVIVTQGNIFGYFKVMKQHYCCEFGDWEENILI